MNEDTGIHRFLGLVVALVGLVIPAGLGNVFRVVVGIAMMIAGCVIYAINHDGPAI